jgi:hypothetical protein
MFNVLNIMASACSVFRTVSCYETCEVSFVKTLVLLLFVALIVRFGLSARLSQNKATQLAPRLIPSERRFFGRIFQRIRAEPLFKQRRPHRRYGMEAHHVGVDRHRSTCANRSRR